MHLFRLSFLLRRLVLDFEMKKAIIRIQLRWMTQRIEWWLRGETGKSPPSDDQLHIVANAKIITWHERCFRFRLSDCWVGRGKCVGEGVNEGRRRNWFPEVHPVSIRTTALRHDRFPSSLPSSPLPASPLPSSPAHCPPLLRWFTNRIAVDPCTRSCVRLSISCRHDNHHPERTTDCRRNEFVILWKQRRRKRRRRRRRSSDPAAVYQLEAVDQI